MRVVTLFSGGLDSATLAHLLRVQGHEQTLLAVDYGQRHAARELAAARGLAAGMGLPLVEACLPLSSLLPGSALTDRRVGLPHAPAGDPVQAATVVPGRNLVLLALGAAYAAAHGHTCVAYGPNAGDAAVYRDCRAAFVDAMQAAVQAGAGAVITLYAPFLGMSKREVAALARKLSVPVEGTWSCYEGGAEPCGACGACAARREALA